MKILVLGSAGQLGKCIGDKFASSEHNMTYINHTDIDISIKKNIEKLIYDLKPNIVINAAAYTNVDLAEKQYFKANAINNIALKYISKACLHIKSVLIHISTDYVFDGTSSSPYTETDATNPLGVYGKSKLDGEHAIVTSGCEYMIIRTSWVYSEYGKNFLKTMLELFKKQNEINVISDQYGCPTYAQDLAQAIKIITGFIEKSKHKSGIYNYCGNLKYSWFDFAQEILANHNSQKSNNIRINPIYTKDIKSLSLRPKYSVLDCSKYFNTFKFPQSDTALGIKKTLSALTKLNSHYD